MEESAILELGAGLIEAVIRAITEALRSNDTSTLEALRPVLRDSAELAQLDEALVAVQRAKAVAELRP